MNISDHAAEDGSEHHAVILDLAYDLSHSLSLESTSSIYQHDYRRAEDLDQTPAPGRRPRLHDGRRVGHPGVPPPLLGAGPAERGPGPLFRRPDRYVAGGRRRSGGNWRAFPGVCPDLVLQHGRSDAKRGPLRRVRPGAGRGLDPHTRSALRQREPGNHQHPGSGLRSAASAIPSRRRAPRSNWRRPIALSFPRRR